MKNRVNSTIDQLFSVMDMLNSRKRQEDDLKDENKNKNKDSISRVSSSINYNFRLSIPKQINSNTKLIRSVTVRSNEKNSHIHEVNTDNDLKDLLISKDLSYKKKIHESFKLNQVFYNKTSQSNSQLLRTKKNVVFLNLNDKHFSSEASDELKNTNNHNKIIGNHNEFNNKDNHQEVFDSIIKNTFDSVNSLKTKGKSISNKITNPNFRKSNFISFDLSNLITKTTTFTLSSLPSLPSSRKNKERLLIKSVINKDLTMLTDDEIHFLKTSKNLDSTGKSKVLKSLLFNLSNKNLLLKSKVNLNNIVKRRLYEEYL